MYKGDKSKFVPILIIAVISVVAVIALVLFARAVFGGNDNSSSSTVEDSSQQKLLNTSLGRSVQMSVRGPIDSDENFQEYSIRISPQTRTFTATRGYEQTVTESKSYDNNSAAYEQFVYALSRANYMKGEQFTGEKDDTRGICATGRLYDFTVLDNGQASKHLWTSTCRGSKGSLDASVAQVKDLFTAQVPDYSKLMDPIEIY